jgi:hypothetical protein
MDLSPIEQIIVHLLGHCFCLLGHEGRVLELTKARLFPTAKLLAKLANFVKGVFLSLRLHAELARCLHLFRVARLLAEATLLNHLLSLLTQPNETLLAQFLQFIRRPKAHYVLSGLHCDAVVGYYWVFDFSCGGLDCFGALFVHLDVLSVDVACFHLHHCLLTRVLI